MNTLFVKMRNEVKDLGETFVTGDSSIERFVTQ